MPLLELQSIGKDFPGVRALDGVSLAVEAGEIHALCGENGAGKSTLLKILSGYYPAGSFAGAIRLRGRDVRFDGIRDAEHHGVALIAQELALVPEMSVAENLFLGRESTRRGLLRTADMEIAARRALGRVGLDVDPRLPVRRFGIGAQQLVEIAKALSKQAAILVLDEPTAALPEDDARRLHALLRELCAHGTACLYVSHRLEEVFALADRITVLRDGRTVASAPRVEFTLAEVIRHMVGRDVVPADRRAGAAPPREVLLHVECWTVHDAENPRRAALENAGLTLHAGEILGVAGLMGAGRTALLASLFGAARGAVRGRLQLAGRASEQPFRSPREAVAAGVMLVSEDRRRFGLVPEASVLENLTLATLRACRRRGLLDASALAARAGQQVEALHVRATSLRQRVLQLSGGNQQKVVLGKWLLAQPRVLLLDEPTRGVDVGAKAEIHRLIRDLASRGLGMVVVSSDLPELLSLSDRMIVLNQGRVAAQLEGDALNPETIMAAATA
jgi:D-xylose transport system ATP-binding protein